MLQRTDEKPVLPVVCVYTLLRIAKVDVLIAASLATSSERSARTSGSPGPGIFIAVCG
jgi:hypothetical protein